MICRVTDVDIPVIVYATPYGFIFGLTDRDDKLILYESTYSDIILACRISEAALTYVLMTVHATVTVYSQLMTSDGTTKGSFPYPDHYPVSDTVLTMDAGSG